ncbi:Anaphase-promoting complex subunit 23 [Lunasporangiospora selenospora]|uniref:Anaphase-promoting complex subunit 23 n=1 Tax=Lunasporangiospora selenospora TaxID=979761 RepID=A0A9P6KF19_9FUNG|nr:Anaphase-promoting complex subunit 23 [Lunasporangiospora selenospora]
MHQICPSQVLYLIDTLNSQHSLLDYNRNDYRAWNGLGQAYEVLKMYPGALENYQRAARLRPYDGQIRCAMAESYESMGRDTDAIKCFERVLVLSGQDMVAIIKLPKLYKKIGDKMNAVRCFRRSLGYLHEYQADSEDTSEACLYLAEYERDGGNVVEASKYAKEALHSSSDRHREEARAMLQGFGHVSEPLLDRVHSCWSDFAAPEDRNR